ncbi:DUF1330 domain-containing protein [Sphingomonas sp. 37zxx]|uniref:DUF1330 domain-containing protein n=1 Tax=Sphingomonas sp. 37zxx TaxID=1550073 RepID=UPI00053BF718|nr:DUF1330 domain-containing protein [Sphingomonas sp. 37zxx]
MIVVNAVMPSAEQAAAFLTGDEGPFVMINLLKFKPWAEYPDGADAHLTGVEAYMRYGVAVRAHLERVGATPGYVGRVTGLLLGEVGELWDSVALAHYPSLAAMRAMVEHPDYQAISVHRVAGLAGQLNIKTQGSGV